MIPTAPLPHWSDIFHSFGGIVPSDTDLSRPWRREDEAGIWFSRASFAFELLARWWKDQNEGSVPNFWIPNYFCNQSLEPLRSTGAKITFYPITDDLEPDWDRCRTMLRSERPDFFTLVHYFGHSCGAQLAVEFCRDSGALLIEDAAHVLKSGDGVGEHGDFVIYSPYKFLPIPDGGLMIARNHVDIEGLRTVHSKLSGRAPGPIVWVTKRTIQKSGSFILAAAKSIRTRAQYLADPATKELGDIRVMSSYARRMVSRYHGDLSNLAMARKSNAAKLREIYAHPIAAVPLFSETEEGSAPYRFVLRAANDEAASKLFDQLSAARCPVESWPDLPPEIRANPEAHANAINLRNTLVFLPVHQSIDAEELASTCSCGAMENTG